MTVKRLFAGKPVRVGSYRLKLAVDQGSKWLSFKVVKASVVSSLISAGEAHTCAVLGGGAVKCWGSNANGQLGDGISDHGTSDEEGDDMSPVPVQAQGIAGAIQISAGGSHTCAVLSGGTAKCWGDNFFGQLGDGSLDNSPTPVLVSGVTNAVQIAAGSSHTCALSANATVECWGLNPNGETAPGDTDYQDAATPAKVTGIKNAVQISAGAFVTCALLADGTVKCWESTARSATSRVAGITGAVQVSTGDDYACALLSRGTIKCWSTGSAFSSPYRIKGVASVTQISAGGEHACALLFDGGVWCWGNNFYGQLGDASDVDDSTTPVEVSVISNATQIDAGASHTCALLADRTVRCWGQNFDGRLGDGTTEDSSTPVEVSGILVAARPRTGTRAVRASSVTAGPSYGLRPT